MKKKSSDLFFFIMFDHKGQTVKPPAMQVWIVKSSAHQKTYKSPSVIMYMICQSNTKQEEIYMLKLKTKSRDIDESQLSHTKYNCLYHIVFIPKFRRKAIYGKLRRDIGIILRRLCEYKEVDIIGAHACIDHIHMLVRIPPKLSV